MLMNSVDNPNVDMLTDIMRKVNAYGHQPRVLVELDKFSYVRGLKKKYKVVDYVESTTTKTIVTANGNYGGGEATGNYFYNYPTIPLANVNRWEDVVVTARHGSVNKGYSSHTGLDMDLETGDPVCAAWSGKVVRVHNHGNTSYGKVVYIDHGNGIQTRYAHLDEFKVSVGDMVKQGQIIGLGGNTGNSTGSHLHFEIRENGKHINPEPILQRAYTFNSVPLATNSRMRSDPDLLSGTYDKTTTTGTAVITYLKHFTSDPQITDKYHSDDDYGVFPYDTPDGVKRALGFYIGVQAGEHKLFSFDHTWFNDGYFKFKYYYKKGTALGVRLELRMDGQTVWANTTLPAGNVVIDTPAPIRVPNGRHRMTFHMIGKDMSELQARFGVSEIECGEFQSIIIQEENTVDVTPVGEDESGNPLIENVINISNWDYEDLMNDLGMWYTANNPNVRNGGEFIQISGCDGKLNEFKRREVVKYPFTFYTTISVEPPSDVDSNEGAKAQVHICNGSKGFTANFTDKGIGSFEVDNTKPQTYLLVTENGTSMDVYWLNNGLWEDTGVNISQRSCSNNEVSYRTPADGCSVLKVYDTKYVHKYYSMSGSGVNTIPVTTVDRKESEKWYELGGFVFDETYYLEDDIISWEVSNHMDMASSTATVTLSNHKGIYSPEYARDSIFPNNKAETDLVYVENGIRRHVISEYTPVRIYAGYGEQMVRVFTGMIKGEITEDSEKRTLTFNCVDRFDLLEEAVLLEPMSFPPVEDQGLIGDGIRRPWIKSSIVQKLAVYGGMTGWRYVYEDLQYPDLAIEDTYYTDVNKANGHFMRFNSEGVLEQVDLGEVKSPLGYRNPYVEDVVFERGEKVSDCIHRIVDEINFRVYCDRYGTFVMEKLDFINNMKWDFKSGENLFSLNSSTDYSKVRNHIIVAGANGSTEHFFDKDLIIATKGHIRTASLQLMWLNDANGISSVNAKKEVADKLFFDMKRQCRTKNVVVKGNPFIEVLDGCYVYDDNTSTAGYYIIKGNTLMGDSSGMVNKLELTWEEKVN